MQISCLFYNHFFNIMNENFIFLVHPFLQELFMNPYSYYLLITNIGH